MPFTSGFCWSESSGKHAEPSMLYSASRLAVVTVSYGSAPTFTV